MRRSPLACVIGRPTASSRSRASASRRSRKDCIWKVYSILEEMQVQSRLGVGGIEQQRRLVLAPRILSASDELVGVAEIVMPARVPRRQRDAGFPQHDLAAVVELAQDTGGREKDENDGKSKSREIA